MLKIILKISVTLSILYISLCGLLFVFQEKFIFFPEKLDPTYKFSFEQKFEEIYFKTSDDIKLHGLLFNSDNSNGLIFYLHGNAGSLRSWGAAANAYTDLNYDVFMLDYRGYGKSEGSISNEEQIYQDVQTAYNEMKKRYDEEKIVILGYSISTGIAAKIASINSPKLLILQAPYYSLTDLMKQLYPIIPAFLLKYKFATNEYIKDCGMPIVIFHGTHDEVVNYKSSIKLQKLLKPGDKFITLNGQRHNGMTDNPDYRVEIKKLLAGK
jgi:alpha-beta hydrolase superfamily lysophospholipase